MSDVKNGNGTAQDARKEDWQKEEKSQLKSKICALTVFNLDQKHTNNEDLWETENQGRADEKGKLIFMYHELPNLERSDYEFLVKRCHELLINDAVLMPENIRDIHREAKKLYKQRFSQDVLEPRSKGEDVTVAENELYFCLRYLACDKKFLRWIFESIIAKMSISQRQASALAKAYVEILKPQPESEE